MSIDKRAPRTEADTARMTAVTQHRYGSSPEEVLSIGRVPVPAPGPGEVLLAVAAASVDRGTWHAMAGLPYPIRLAGFGLRRPKFLNPGASVAGTVAAVGEGVTGFAEGDSVYGAAEASFAEYAIARPAKLAVAPRTLTPQEAAAVPVSGITALQAVRDHGRVSVGDQVLVLGASGGVGTFLVQLAKAAGATVTAVCGGAKADGVRALGADVVLDYRRQEPSGRFDVIFDIGGNRRLSVLRTLLTDTGRLVIIGGETDGRLLGGVQRQLGATLVSRFARQQLGTFLATVNAADLRALGELLDAGAVRPVVDRVYPLAETPAALRRLLDGGALGKIVVSVA